MKLVSPGEATGGPVYAAGGTDVVVFGEVKKLEEGKLEVVDYVEEEGVEEVVNNVEVVVVDESTGEAEDVADVTVDVVLSSLLL